MDEMVIGLGLCWGLSASGLWCSSSPARVPAPLTPAARSQRRRAAHQSKDLKEAVLQTWNKLANSEGRAHQLASRSRMQMESSPACTLISSTSTSVSSELGWAWYTTNEGFMMSKPRLQQAAALVLVLHQLRFRHLCATHGRCPVSSAAVGETVPRHAIEPRSSHGRHGGRERRGQLPCHRLRAVVEKTRNRISELTDDAGS